MDLVCEVLDNQLIDRNGRRMGKVDGIVLEVREGQPPRVTALMTGGPTLAYRLHPRLGTWMQALARRWSPTGGQAVRIPWAKVRDVGIDIELDLQAEETGALAWERWVRDHIVDRLPGAG